MTEQEGRAARPATRTTAVLAVAVVAAVLLALLPDVRSTWQRASAAVAWRTGTTVHTLRIDGVRRTYRVYRPAGLPAAAPLVVFLHPAFGNARQAQGDYHWDDVADASKVVVAYPDGIGATWNAGSCCGRAQSRGIDDVAFVSAMVGQIRANIGIDPAQVHAVGFSNGAFMAERLACDTGLFAGIAEVAGTRVTTSCTPAAATAPSVLYVHGLADTNVRWDGEPGSGVAKVDGEPRETSLTAWRDLAGGCGPAARRDDLAGTTQVVRTTWTCARGRAVAAITLSDAGHQYPGAVDHPAQDRALGLPAPSTAIDATAEIWAFLAAHPRQP